MAKKRSRKKKKGSIRYVRSPTHKPKPRRKKKGGA
jgi:hypothetical protein